MSNMSDLEKRMREFYEDAAKTYLTRRMPVIIRVDGKGFKHVTRNFEFPCDDHFRAAMADTAKDLLNNVQGAVFAYTQSDEISLFLKDYTTLETQALYGYGVQKIVSVVASMTSTYFNKHIGEYEGDAYQEVAGTCIFDARTFNIPKEEVTNYFYWRQTDCERNAIQAIARSVLTKSGVRGHSCKTLVTMLADKDVDIKTYPEYFLHGYCLYKKEGRSVVCEAAPMFTGNGRDTIEKLIE